MKRCSKCGLELPLDDFHVDKGHSDGRASRCKHCRANWVASRKSSIAQYNAHYYVRNRERRIIEIHEYQRFHPEVQVKYRHGYRARKYQAEGGHTLSDLRDIFAAQNGHCFYCGLQLASTSEGHFDHVIPLARGGSDNADNIVFACPACNWAKHDRLPNEWRPI
jgi:5-methylcytosine-specific restriction endonuclease McrA